MNKNVLVRFLVLLVLVMLVLSGCSTVESTPPTAALSEQSQAEAPAPSGTPERAPEPTDAIEATKPPKVSEVVAKSTLTPTEPAPNEPAETKPTPQATLPPPEDWKEWPVLPTGVSDHLREVYRDGLARGNNPHAFSVMGDCQSQPEVFMGILDNDPAFVRALSTNLQATVKQFAGSFDRYSPTVKDGTTEGALLWAQWNDNKEGKCEPNETPIDCELRVHRPSIVYVHIGTHWEARNRTYLEKIMDKIIESGAVPVLVTKADNRELDERVNANLVSLAAEYDLPLWNFWASVQHLPENGMEPGSDMYLSPEGLIIHRQGALETLDLVWRALNED